MVRGNFQGKGVAHYKIQQLSATSWAKTAEPIEMPFGLSSRVVPRKLVLVGVDTGEYHLTHPRAVATWPRQITLTTSCNHKGQAKITFFAALHFLN